ncbi:penicillin acylase family protein [Amphiplicatus metriothermophilus]|uniref:Penicillin amidase/acyl-homoserine-lactone acylase n=1 Tax=Amphiplicatus metriothermophilus TaxID=1519374 RepID=A0A239PR85_9PROT|nr:penicillin acylase family protein [Amphiplicatus metriothermophilus]MBB5518615.1 penicillin amidase/acyl-homoserine-lactone acylase [Amphiplicatus metriothermophilus]SNT72227.1 penicillin amidase/acyl-homoserine-lactone acylase [Amphiplicatus metriothermophilus]
MRVVGFGALALIVAAGVWLWTPAPRFDAAEAKRAAQAYDARIIRDAFGAPHIYGARDVDVAFGLAYAHAEDDWATFEDALAFSRGTLGRRLGRKGAVTDYLVAALRIREDVARQYEAALSARTRALLEAYAAGVNLWCAEEKGRCARGVAPVTGQDVAAGFAVRTPFFYGLDEMLTALFEAEPETHAALERARHALLHLGPNMETGSNAVAVAPGRSADGHTRLMVNSHQPYAGPVAWYEARVKSDEGWDMIGGVFPGAPVILHGAGPALGWAFTVNKPDLADVYRLEVDDPKRPRRYRFDGEWRDFDRAKARLRVKIFGPFSLPVTREILRSVHGPAFVTPSGVYAVSYAGMGDIRAPEQWLRMNKAASFDEWRAAMAMQAIASFNVVYADREGNIAFYHNAAIPVRSSEWDWSRPAPGDRPDLLWKGTLPFGSAPSVVNPASGYVVNGNNNPFEASGAGDNPDPARYPPHYGIDARTTNRGIRLQALYGTDGEITGEEFVAYKMDHFYAEESRLRRLVGMLIESEAVRQDPALAEARALLEGWTGSTRRTDRAAALAVRTGERALGYLLAKETPDEAAMIDALRATISELQSAYGRIDPEWGELNRLRRGDVDLPLNGGPDVLRAVYLMGDPLEGTLAAAGGDSYILYADWSSEGALSVKTIHQFGSATQDETSPHYADQAPLFAAEEWKTPPMTLDALLAEATADYRPGRIARE